MNGYYLNKLSMKARTNNKFAQYSLIDAIWDLEEKGYTVSIDKNSETYVIREKNEKIELPLQSRKPFYAPLSELPMFDSNDRRIVTCDICNQIVLADSCWIYGGINSVNIGKCKKCS